MGFTRSSRAVVCVFAACVGVVAAAAQTPSRLTRPIDNSRLTALPGNVHPLARPEYDRGAVAGSLPMERMLLVLRRSPEQEKNLQSLIQSQHDPSSANFQKWLTPAEFGARFGPATSDLARVSQWLQDSGFQVNKIYQSGMVLEFSGTAADVQRVFHTQIHQYEVNGRSHTANAEAPQIPEALMPVVSGVASIHNFTKHPLLHRLGLVKASSDEESRKLIPVNPNASFNGSNYVSPGDFWTIYNAAPLITSQTSRIDGKGQVIAITGRSDVLTSDIAQFRSLLLPAPYATTLPFHQIINGPDPGSVEGDNGENTLDVEWSSALAPAATVDLVVSKSTATTDGVDLSALYIVDNNLAPVMSTSYGLCEAFLGVAENQFISNLWEQAAAQGITVMVSSGDNGAAGCDDQNASGDPANPTAAVYGLQVNGLSSTPFNVSVGGNELTDDSATYWGKNQSTPAPYTSALSYIPEAVWNESCSPLDASCGGPAQASLWAGSGGASSCLNASFDTNLNLLACNGAYPKPFWQTGVPGIPHDSVRDLPDVSFTAAGHDGYLMCFVDPLTDPSGASSCANGYFAVVGGTSASTPAFAGVMSLVNQNTGSRQGQANYALYALAAQEFASASNLKGCNASQGNAAGSSCIFHDVTAGTNSVPCAGGSRNCSSTISGTFGTLTAYKAAPGYDQATGLGSVNIANLVNDWKTVTDRTRTTVTLTLTPATGLSYGQGAHVTISVSAAGGGIPAGDVALVSNSADVDSQGIGRFTLTNGAFTGIVTSLPAGTYTVYARYAGSRTYSSSVSSGIPVIIRPTISATIASVTAADPITGNSVPVTTAPYGSNIVFSASVKGASGLATPIGSVSFQTKTTTLGTAILDGNGNASYSTASYSVGSYPSFAVYSGDHNYISSSAPFNFAVVKAQPVLKLFDGAGIVVSKDSTEITARIETHSLQANPSGKIVFYVGDKVAGSSPVSSLSDPVTGASDGFVTFRVLNTMLTPGPNAVRAVYSGDANYQPATSPTVNINYAPQARPNSVHLRADPCFVRAGDVITLIAEAKIAGFTATGGTVTFYDGNAILGNIQVAGVKPATGYRTGLAKLRVRLAPGIHVIAAQFGGVAGASTVVESEPAQIFVWGRTASMTSLSAQPNASNPANYDLTAAVFGYGFAAPAHETVFEESGEREPFGRARIEPHTATHTLTAPSLNDNGPGTAFSMAVADFNGDGIPDLATSDAAFSQSTGSVYLGKGDGTFAPPVHYSAGYFPDGVVVGDFNNDGIPDFAVANQGDTGTNGSVSVFLGKGDGTFENEIRYQTNIYAGVAQTADFNRDGILDLAVPDLVSGKIQIAYGNGDGTFTTGPLIPALPAGHNPYDLKAADLNRDGNVDLIEVDNSGGQLAVLLGKSDHTFQTPMYFAVGSGPTSVVVGDMNADGKPDLVVSNYGANTMGVLLGNGDGTFQTMATVSTGGAFDETTYLADINGDGKLDAIGASYYNNGAANILQVFPGNGDGTLGNPVNYALPQAYGQAAIAADLNGDGTPDILAAQTNATYNQGYVVVYLNGTQASATLKNVPIPGPAGTSEQIKATYKGDEKYSRSTSGAATVTGSGARGHND